jgi:hypothetical protein
MSRVVSHKTARRVQARANFMCEYCKLPDFLGFARFEIDHVIAKAHRGNNDLDNLAWACFSCNVNKGPNLSSIDPLTGRVTNLFNPRHDRWDRHFRLSEGLLIPLTAKARTTIMLLNLNDSQTFALRRAFEQSDPDYLRRAVLRCD